MKIKIIGYGVLKDYLGVNSPEGKEYHLTSNKSIGQLLDELNIPSEIVMLISVNDQIKELDYFLKDGDEIKLIPPISGG